MGRPRQQFGRVTLRTETDCSVWYGSWYTYHLIDGKEVRRHVQRAIGRKAGADEANLAPRHAVLPVLTRSQALQVVYLAANTTPVTQETAPAAPISLEVFARERYIHLHLAAWRRNTRETALIVFEKHIFPRWGHLSLKALDAVEISAWLAEMAQAFSMSMVRKCATYLRAVVRQAVDEDLLPKDPLRRLVMPTKPRSAKPVVGLEAIEAIAGELAGLQDQLIWSLAVYCGFRPGELFGLRWNDFDGAALRVDEAWVRGRSEEPKTRASWAAVAVPASVAARLELWRVASGGTDGAFIFRSAAGSPVDTRNWQRRVLQPALERAGVGHVTFQMVRRTWATLAHQAGASPKTVQAQLRHASLSTTMDVYTQPVRSDVTEAVENLAKLIKMP